MSAPYWKVVASTGHRGYFLGLDLLAGFCDNALPATDLESFPNRPSCRIFDAVDATLLLVVLPFFPAISLTPFQLKMLR